MEMEIRSFEIRSVDTEKRTIEGIAAPFNETFDAGDFKENFAPGVFGDIDHDSDIRLYSEHDHLDKRAPIGMVTKGENTDDGYVIKARISSTAKGNEVYELVKDGVLRNFSVGFKPVESTYDADTNTVTHTKGELGEVSVVAFPAYKSAGITAVRNQSLAVRSNEDSSEINNEKGVSNEPTMNDEINYASAADLEEFRSEVDRRLAVVAEQKPEVGTLYRSAGEFVKAHAAGDTQAIELYRSYTGATTAKSHGNGWLDVPLKTIDRGRKVVNAFARGTLPASGNTVTYPYVASVSGAVASQVAEGDDLTQLDLTVSTRSVDIRTFGVKSDLSLQVIQRSDVGYLDEVLRKQAASYAKVTNDYVRTVLAGASAQSGTSFTRDSADAADWLEAVIDGVSKIDANSDGLAAEFVLMSSDMWGHAVSTASTGFAFDVNGSTGLTVGNANVPAISGSIAGLPVIVDGGLSAKTMFVASSDALTTWENAGAPIRLDAENPVNLTHVYSIYGFIAAGVTDANGLVKPTVA